MQTSTTSKSSVCACDFNLDPEVHDALLAIESAPALDALELLGTLTLCEVFEFEPGDFSHFVVQHNWNRPADMARLGALFDGLADGYVRSRS